MTSGTTGSGARKRHAPRSCRDTGRHTRRRLPHGVGGDSRVDEENERAVKGDRGAKKNAVKRVASAERRRKRAVSRDKERGRKKARGRGGKREKRSESRFDGLRRSVDGRSRVVAASSP